MNSHASSSFLLAAIAIFITEAGVRGARIMSRPGMIADHNSNSLIVLKKVVGARSRITDPSTIVIKILPIKITTRSSDMEIQCCEPQW